MNARRRVAENASQATNATMSAAAMKLSVAVHIAGPSKTMNFTSSVARSKSAPDSKGFNHLSSLGMAAASVLQNALLKPAMSTTLAMSTTKSRALGGGTKCGRSEEHTSELQSL